MARVPPCDLAHWRVLDFGKRYASDFKEKQNCVGGGGVFITWGLGGCQFLLMVSECG